MYMKVCPSGLRGSTQENSMLFSNRLRKLMGSNPIAFISSILYALMK